MNHQVYIFINDILIIYNLIKTISNIYLAEFYRKYERKLKRRDDRKKIEELQYKNEQLFANNHQSPTKISPIKAIINKDFENFKLAPSKNTNTSIITKPKSKFMDQFKASIFDDLGINLDPAFNKFRKNKLGLETIIFFVNFLKLEVRSYLYLYIIIFIYLLIIILIIGII
jgi:hypothetical protein